MDTVHSTSAPAATKYVWLYARVSTPDQNLDRQVKKLQEAAKGYGDAQVQLLEEKYTGATTSRPELEKMMLRVRPGDVVLVKSPDRLARNTRDLLDLLQGFNDRGVDVHFLDNTSLNIGKSSDRLILTVLGAIAEFERELIRERQREGIAVAKQAGKYPPRFSEEQVLEIRRARAMGVPVATLAKQYKASRTTSYAVLQATGVYAQDPVLE